MAAQTASSTAPASSTAQPASTETAIDKLQAMLNMVLITSGRFLKEQAARPNSNAQQSLSRTIPAAAERFHIALDELEDDILQAQVVLRRDLALLKADRRRREAAAKEQEAEKARLAAASSVKKEPPKKEELPAPAAAATATSTAAATSAMVAPASTAQQLQQQSEAPKAAALPPKPDSKPSALNRDLEDFPPPINTSAAPDTERDPLFDGTPTTANAQDTEFDFDAMFGDGAMDTSGDGNDQGDFNMDTSGPDLNFSLDDSQPSLLRGLEDFAKSGDDDAAGQTSNANNNNPNNNSSTAMDLDFAMPDLDDIANTASTEQQPASSKPAEASNTQQTADTTTATATADDTSNFLDTMTTDNLDDLFNLDEENPEATQFDDAFFGFGES